MSDDRDIMEDRSGSIKEKADETSYQKQIENTCAALAKFLAEKNRQYGDSALEPLRIFSQENSTEGLLVRIDDKLSRIKNRTSFPIKGNDLWDLIGYLVLLIVNMGCTDPYEFFD